MLDSDDKLPANKLQMLRLDAGKPQTIESQRRSNTVVAFELRVTGFAARKDEP